jgi:hypothetical protein
VRFVLRGSKKKEIKQIPKKKRGITGGVVRCTDYKRDTGFSANCRYRCTQLIWSFGMQESVLFVMGDMLGVLPNCI